MATIMDGVMHPITPGIHIVHIIPGVMAGTIPGITVGIPLGTITVIGMDPGFGAGAIGAFVPGLMSAGVGMATIGLTTITGTVVLRVTADIPTMDGVTVAVV